MSLIIRDLLKMGQNQLEKANIADAELDAKGIMCFAFDWSGRDLFMNWGELVDENRCERYFELIESRSSGRPMQYITGVQEFMGLPFIVDENVLIPRQDTERLVETAKLIIESNNHKKAAKREGEHLQELVRSRKNWSVLDLCCGSGAIGVSIAKLCPNTDVTCADISSGALAVANKNAQANNVAKSVSFAEGDMFNAFKRKKKFDMILSNPPYVKREEINELQKEIREYEPMMALDGGVDGLDFYRNIISNAENFLEKEGVLMMEIGYDQAEDVVHMLEERQVYCNIEVIKDYAGLDRVVGAALIK